MKDRFIHLLKKFNHKNLIGLYLINLKTKNVNFCNFKRNIEINNLNEICINDLILISDCEFNKKFIKHRYTFKSMKLDILNNIYNLDEVDVILIVNNASKTIHYYGDISSIDKDYNYKYHKINWLK